MFYKRTKMMDELRVLVENHREKYGQDPKRIYVTGTEWDLYEQELPACLRQNYSAAGYPKLKLSNKVVSPMKTGIIALHFQGIPIVMIKDWKWLIGKK